MKRIVLLALVSLFAFQCTLSYAQNPRHGGPHERQGRRPDITKIVSNLSDAQKEQEALPALRPRGQAAGRDLARDVQHQGAHRRGAYQRAAPAVQASLQGAQKTQEQEEVSSHCHIQPSGAVRPLFFMPVRIFFLYFQKNFVNLHPNSTH